jgi:uncharacterized protein
MELSNEFTVALPPDRAWAVLTDIERIAPCLPGAALTEINGDQYKGTVKVKVGPITATYKGTAHFVERDDDNRVAVIKAEGRDTRQGTAAATIRARVVPDTASGGSKVSVNTDLLVAGKVAQFGRNVLGDVSAKLMNQFADALNADLAEEALTEEPPSEGDPTGGAVPAVDSEPEPQVRPEREVAPVDLLETAGMPVLKRAIPVALGVLLLFLVLRRLRRR